MNVRPASIGLTCCVWLVVLASTACTNSGNVCDGATGECTPCETSSECPEPATACVLAVCNGGQCSTSHAARSTACIDSGGKVCDGAGRCLGCLDNDSDCCFPAAFCQVNVCVKASCTDGRRDGNESSLDCGGSCPACPNHGE